MIEPGRILLGKYRIERVLGRGGMGTVALAHHLGLDEPVAIKLLLPEMAENQDVVRRFLREAQAAVKLKNEHICRVLDVGQLENGAPYLVMEYLQGTDLGDLLESRGSLPAGEAVDLVLQACTALAEAHARGIVHRDVKPANIFLTRTADGAPLVKLLDFGISKAPSTGAEMTKTRSLLGTPCYMSPEQMRDSKNVDMRSDIWALGVVLYELVSGRRPFQSESITELVLKVASEPAPRLGVPVAPDFAAAVHRCLEKDPANRFQNVVELAAALVPYAGVAGTAMNAVTRASRILGVPVPADGVPGHGIHDVPTPVDRSSPVQRLVDHSSPAQRPQPAGERAASAVPTTLSNSLGQIAVNASDGPERWVAETRSKPRRLPFLLAATVVTVAITGVVLGVVLSDDSIPEQSATPAGSLGSTSAAGGMSALPAAAVVAAEQPAAQPAAPADAGGAASESDPDGAPGEAGVVGAGLAGDRAGEAAQPKSPDPSAVNSTRTDRNSTTRKKGKEGQQAVKKTDTEIDDRQLKDWPGSTTKPQR